MREELADGKARRKVRYEEDQDGVSRPVPVTLRVPDILRAALGAAKLLLRMMPQGCVVVREWQGRAMHLQNIMCTAAPLKQQARAFFKRHATVHYALVHCMDSVREQRAPNAVDAVKGRILMLEAGEHTHQLHSRFVTQGCRLSAALRCHDLLYITQLLRGLAIRHGYVPVTYASHASFHY